MSDLIRREDAIKAMQELSEHYTEKGREWHPHIDFVIDELKMLQSAAMSSWIPCSEKMPEKHGRYLTTSIFDGNRRTTYRWFSDDDREFDFWDVDEEIIAWMPLPEPYNEDE